MLLTKCKTIVVKTKCHFIKRKKLQTYKPNSVIPPSDRENLYHLSSFVVTNEPNLPTPFCYPENSGQWSEQLHFPNLSAETVKQGKPKCTWHFNPQGLSPSPIARERRALLPHVFTLTPRIRGGYFLRHSLYPENSGPHPLDGVVLYVVRTFLFTNCLAKR